MTNAQALERIRTIAEECRRRAESMQRWKPPLRHWQEAAEDRDIENTDHTDGDFKVKGRSTKEEGRYDREG